MIDLAVLLALLAGTIAGTIVTSAAWWRDQERQADRALADRWRVEATRIEAVHRRAGEGWRVARETRAELLAHEAITREIVSDTLDRAARILDYRTFLTTYGRAAA